MRYKISSIIIVDPPVKWELIIQVTPQLMFNYIQLILFRGKYFSAYRAVKDVWAIVKVLWFWYHLACIHIADNYRLAYLYNSKFIFCEEENQIFLYVRSPNMLQSPRKFVLWFISYTTTLFNKEIAILLKETF